LKILGPRVAIFLQPRQIQDNTSLLRSGLMPKIPVSRFAGRLVEYKLATDGTDEHRCVLVAMTQIIMRSLSYS